MSAAVNGKNGLKWLFGLTAALLAWRFWLLPNLGITLYVDEAQYWTWAQHLDWGYFSKPPGVAALIWLSTALFGDGMVGVKALSDALLTLFWALALWAYLRALDTDAWRDWLLLGAICGLGLLSKYTMAAWLGAALLHLLVFQRARLVSAKPWLAAGLALLMLSPNIVWNFIHDFPTLKHTADITLNRTSGGGLASLGEFWAAQWIAFGPVLGSVFALLLVRARESWRDDRTRLLLWFALPLWAVVSMQAMKSSANANWAAPAFAPAVIAVVAWLLQRAKKKLLITGLAINLAIVGLVYHWPQVIAAVNPEKQAKLNPFKRAMGWDDLGRHLKPILLAHSDSVLIADNRTLLAHMLYELRDIKPTAASWNPSGVASDHYKLTTDLRPYIGKDALLITQEVPGEAFTTRFAGMEKIATLKATLDAHTSRDMDVYLLHEFKGY